MFSLFIVRCFQYSLLVSTHFSLLWSICWVALSFLVCSYVHLSRHGDILSSSSSFSFFSSNFWRQIFLLPEMVWNGKKIGRITSMTPWFPLLGREGGEKKNLAKNISSSKNRLKWRENWSNLFCQSHWPFWNNLFLFFLLFNPRWAQLYISLVLFVSFHCKL